MFKRFLCLLFICLLCAACGPQAATDKNSNAVSVTNYTFTGEPQQVNFAHIPQRILVCGNSGVETLLALGAGDKIVAAVLTDAQDKDVLQSKLPKAKIYTQPLQMEGAVALEPDFILGWRRFFADNQLGDTSSWLAKGIAAYIQDASGPIPAKGKFPACTIASEKNFIRNMGAVLGKTVEAETIIKQIDNELQATKPIKAQKVLFVEFLGGNIEVFGDDLLSGDIIKQFGGSLITYSAPFISQEELMTMQADVIFVVYHGGDEQKKVALEKLQNPFYQHIPAIKNKKIHALNYNAIVAPGTNLVQTLRYVRQCLE